jgi:hypothetical protein
MSQAAPLLTGVAAFPSPELALSSGRRFEVRFWQQARCGADVPLQELEDLMPPLRRPEARRAVLGVDGIHPR